jgi:hypothetical protein
MPALLRLWIAGASEKHNIIADNIIDEVHKNIKGKPLMFFITDIKVKARTIFYLDVLITYVECKP